MAYAFESQLVIDPVSGDKAASVSVTVYDANDTGNTAPLALTDLNGNPLANPLTSTVDAFIPPFMADVYKVKLVGGGLTVVAWSGEGLVTEAKAAKEYVQSIDVAATTTAAPGAPAAVTLDKATGKFSFDIPAGTPGPPGKDGANVVPTDEAIANAANDSASQTRGALDSRYAPVMGARPGGRWVALGDSITYGNVDNSQRSIGEAWPTYATVMSQSRVRLVRNAGVPGNKSGDMLARFGSDVAPYAPNLVTIAAGTNDIGQGVPFNTFKANVNALVTKVRSLGAVPVLATIPPRNPDSHATITAWNAWLRDYAERNGLAILDMYRTLVDPANGNYQAAYYNDGIHPNSAGAAAMGEVAAWVLGSMTPNGGPMLPADATDTNNLIGSPGLFLTAQGSGVGTGWNPGSAPANTVKSIVTDPNVVGGTQRITMTNAGSLWEQYVTMTTGFKDGDTLRAVGVLSSDGGAGANVQISVLFTGATTSGGKPLNNISRAITRGVWCQDLVVPAGTTQIKYSLICGAAGATCTVDFAQVGLYNLTAMGV